jgi:two-component system, OmpR family, response regulator
LGKRILVADASETIISVCRKLLGQHGYEVTLFQDGTRALEELKRSDYDLAVIATTTQNVSGQFIIRELRLDAAKAKLPILMLLGSSELLDTQELFDLGPNDTLNKPFSPQELLHRIEGILKTTGETTGEPEEDMDIESILSDDAKSFEKKIADATDKIFLDMLSTTNDRDDESDAPRLDKLDLAEDQYDLESVKMAGKAETDSPHDYDWFVSEMKGDTPPPVKVERPTGPTGKFEVEEVGTSKITLDKLKKMQTATEVEKTKVYLEKLQEPFTDDTGHEPARLKDSRQVDMRQIFVKHFAEALAKEVAKNIDFDKLVEALRAEISRSGQK